MKLAGPIKVGAGIALGYVLGRYLIPLARGVPVGGSGKAPSQPDSSGDTSRPPIYRISGDMRNICRQLDPFLAQLHRDSEDGELSVTDLWNAYGQIRRITG